MRDVLLVPLLALLSVAGYASSCTTTTTDPAPPVPSIMTPSAEPPLPSAQQDVSTCLDACTIAQIACRKTTPKPISECVAKCKDSSQIAGPSLACLAVMFTCDENCS